jgi:hypothetical protein
MSAIDRAPLARRARFGLSFVLGVVLLSCGGNPTSAPGQGAANLPPQTNPGIKDTAGTGKNEGPRRSLKGTVVNAVTGDPIDKVTLFVEGVITTIASTPIPSAPPPGPDDKPGGAERGAKPETGGMQIAVGSDEASGSPFPGADFSPEASLPPGTSPAPGASLPPGASTSPGVSSSPGTARSPGASLPPHTSATTPGAGGLPGNTTPAGPGGPAGTTPGAPVVSPIPGEAGASGAPVAMGTPYPLTPVKPDSRGKFELKDLPEGAYSVTVFAPGYEAQTFQGNLPAEMDLKLRPLDVPKHDLHNLTGVVREATNQAAGNAEVEVSSLAGKFAGKHVTSNDTGAFTMDGLVSGNYSLAGWTSNLDGEVQTFALVKEVPVALGKEKRTVSPTLVLRAVTSPILLAGTVGGSASATDKLAIPKPNALKPQSVRAFIAVGDGEIPIASTTCGKDGYFRLRLPNLPEGATYHLVASGQNDAGQTSYVHKYGVTVADPKLDIPLPEAPPTVSVTDRSRTPAFAWEPVGSDVTAYRVSVESVGQDGDTLWEGWTTGTAIRMPNNKDFTLLHDGESYRYTLTAIRIGDKGKLDLPSIGIQPWASSGMTKPTTLEIGRTKPGAKTSTDPYKPLSVNGLTPGHGSSSKPSSGKPSASPKPAAKGSPKPTSPHPSARPSPRSSRTKPITSI